MAQGVPVKFRHIWKYKGRWDEKKVAPKTWRFTFRASKGKRSKSYGSFGKGTKGKWLIKGVQYIVKTGKGTYQTVLKGTKKSLGFKVKKPKSKRRRY